MERFSCACCVKSCIQSRACRSRILRHGASRSTADGVVVAPCTRFGAARPGGPPKTYPGGEGGERNGRFAELIDQEWRGIEKWKNAVRKGASAARGWVTVGHDLNGGSLCNYFMDTQNLWAVYNMVPCRR
jgi:hypothetical protein